MVLPDGYKVNDLAPFSMEWATEGTTVDGDRSIVEPAFPLEIAATFADGSVAVDLAVYYCQEQAEELCLIERVRIEAVVDAVEGGGATATLRHVIEDPGL